MREFDIVVWATGFDFGTGALTRMGIRGRDGLALEDHWADGPKTFLGVQTTGFPNLFFPGGPHAAAGNNPRYNGDQVDFITDTLVYVRDHGYDTIEVDPAAEERVDRTWSTAARRSSPFGESSYFFGTNIPGKPRKYLLNSGGRPKLFTEIAEVRETDYEAFHLSASRSRPPPTADRVLRRGPRRVAAIRARERSVDVRSPERRSLTTRRSVSDRVDADRRQVELPVAPSRSRNRAEARTEPVRRRAA